MEGLSHKGMVLITGKAGNGKSTLMAGIIRKIRMEPDRYRRIVEYAAPIEFIANATRGPDAPTAPSA